MRLDDKIKHYDIYKAWRGMLLKRREKILNQKEEESDLMSIGRIDELDRLIRAFEKAILDLEFR